MNKKTDSGASDLAKIIVALTVNKNSEPSEVKKLATSPQTKRKNKEAEEEEELCEGLMLIFI